jgi:RimJ/RimL family protein N-acetyltransferase
MEAGGRPKAFGRMGHARDRQSDMKKNRYRIDCGKFLVRTLKADDASDRWASWMADPHNTRLLNAAPRAMTKTEVATYIRQFDQRQHLLLGIFEKKSGANIGFFRVDIDSALNRGLLFFMIGEQRFRHWSVTEQLRVPFQDFLFETLELNMVLATVLASNIPMVRYMLKSGWTFDKKLERRLKSQTDDTMVDLCYLSISRTAWNAWKEKNLKPDA